MITGKIKQIGDIQTFDSGFKKVEFVVTTNEQYPQDVKFEAVKEKAEQLLKYNKVGQTVDVSFNVRGNEYNGKYYVNLQAWKVFTAKTEAIDSAKEKLATIGIEEVDDLPF